MADATGQLQGSTSRRDAARRRLLNRVLIGSLAALVASMAWAILAAR